MSLGGNWNRRGQKKRERGVTRTKTKNPTFLPSPPLGERKRSMPLVEAKQDLAGERGKGGREQQVIGV